MNDLFLLEEKLARKSEKLDRLKKFKKVLIRKAEEEDRKNAETLL
ncbi:MAG: hypothetical protein AAB606_02105 [Patescibacteria group bacterium]